MENLLADYLAYHDEANGRYIQALAREPRAPERAHLLFSHVLNAHTIWLDRIHGRSPAFGVWDLQPPARYAALHVANMEESLRLLAGDVWTRTVAYTNSKGHPFRNTVAEILLHIANHGTYHRGQIASWLRRAGLEPPVTDYIFLRRTAED